MSGHSKWATIKHKKAAVDKTRAKVFAKLARQIEVAAREGGGDASSNASLRTMVLKAKQAQMTNDAIDRAIKRGTGDNGGANYEAITYEGYAPGGVGLLIDVLTDNRNRTGSDIRAVFSKLGGAMAEPGAVSWQFSRKGVIYVDGGVDEDTLVLAALDAGADDVARDGDAWKVTSLPSNVWTVKDAIEAAGMAVVSAESTMVSSTVIDITDASDAQKVLKVMDALEDNDDVQDVYANFDISESVMDLLD